MPDTTATDTQPEPSYTAREFAALEKRPVRAIYDLIHDGHIRAYRLGHTYRIPASELRRIRSGAA